MLGSVDPAPLALSTRAAFRVGVLVFVLAVAAAAQLDPYRFVGDDGGITLRYAERIASGEGFNYNAGERVNGCSNPLYTLALAGMLALGATGAQAVIGLGIASVALAAGVLAATFTRLHSVAGGVLAVLGLMSFDHYFDMQFNGLESALVPPLAALFFAGASLRNRNLTGIALGLLVANKLDGALVALAYTAVELARARRFPVREAAVAVLVAAPVGVILLYSFGSILPNSMSTKVLEHKSVGGFDRLWMHERLWDGFRLIYLPALATLAWAAAERFRGWPSAVLAVQLWLVASLCLYASIDLGAPFPWYLAPALVCSTILAAYGAHRLALALARRFQRGDVGAIRVTRILGHVMGALAVAGALCARGEHLGRVYGPQQGELPLHEIEDLARQAAGAWLRKHTDGSEWLAVAYGLPALEYRGPVYDLAGLNSERDSSRFRASEYIIAGPVPPATPLAWSYAGRLLVGTFQYDAATAVYMVYASEDSQVRKKGLWHLSLPLPGAALELPNTWRRNFITVPVGTEAVSRIAVPAAPRFTFTASARRSRVRLSVACDGVELLDREVGLEPTLHTVELQAPSSAQGLHLFEVTLQARAIDGAHLPDEEARLVDLHFMLGEPLRAADLELTNGRRARRLEWTATGGLPWQRFAR